MRSSRFTVGGASHSLVVLVVGTRVSCTDIANVLKLAVYSGAACRGVCVPCETDGAVTRNSC